VRFQLHLIALRRIWLAVAIFTFIISLDFFAIRQSWDTRFMANFIFQVTHNDLTVKHAAFIGLNWISVLLVITFLLGNIYSKRIATNGPAIIPFSISGIEPETADGKWVCWIGFFLFYFIPVYILTDLLLFVLSFGNSVCFRNGAMGNPDTITVQNIGIFTTDWAQGTDRNIFSFWNHDFKIFASNTTKCEGGKSFAPFVQPILWCIFYLIIIFFFIKTFILMNRNSAQKNN
jgi:hypothetical protein